MSMMASTPIDAEMKNAPTSGTLFFLDLGAGRHTVHSPSSLPFEDPHQPKPVMAASEGAISTMRPLRPAYLGPRRFAA